MLNFLMIGYPTGWTIQRVKPYFSGLIDSWWFGFESEFWGFWCTFQNQPVYIQLAYLIIYVERFTAGVLITIQNSVED